jgi:hypothetical protein
VPHASFTRTFNIDVLTKYTIDKESITASKMLKAQKLFCEAVSMLESGAKALQDLLN